MPTRKELERKGQWISEGGGTYGYRNAERATEYKVRDYKKDEFDSEHIIGFKVRYPNMDRNAKESVDPQAEMASYLEQRLLHRQHAGSSARKINNLERKGFKDYNEYATAQREVLIDEVAERQRTRINWAMATRLRHCGR